MRDLLTRYHPGAHSTSPSLCMSQDVKSYWDVPIYADQQEVRCNIVDPRIVNHKCKIVVTLEIICPWINNRKRKDEKKTLKFGPLH